MTDRSNRQFLLAKRPSGDVRRDDFTYQDVPVSALSDGHILVRNKYLSLDPAMRGWMNEGKSYIPPVQLGEVMRALGVGEVIESKNPKFAVGDHVQGTLGIQDYFAGEPKGFYKVDPSLVELPLYLSALGMTGMTAYFALLDVGQPKSGDTVVISGAAGAVGSIAGQIAKLKGCRVVGIAGGKEKCSSLTQELGFDAAIDYKAENVLDALKRECPNGVNVYFDNVGGDILDAVLSQLAVGARVIICGAISQYNSTTAPKGPANYLSLLVNRARMEGFIVLDHAARFEEAGKELAGWVNEGKLKSKEHIVEGLETFPETLLMLFSGENYGKLMLKVEDKQAS
ncbi:NADP-dependent oxidoreductase [Pseudomonas sp. CDFA 602]|uniref:NADP-dependent oxidoreductase n=1 Tax=Pseudomonas californiensis TaxID=2829823 RepID=UPI001E4AA508|nr:NADP-dependent oxidoreductase [Pseudomonas californiensis]MCD5993066.1 NADP-dependent oxidoreductase [Pseudomonas californiensis]MCD5998443.1 NADP-dependent oxidoreductase [Pseudomonas californiensis]